MRYFKGFWWVRVAGESFGFADIETAFRFGFILN